MRSPDTVPSTYQERSKTAGLFITELHHYNNYKITLVKHLFTSDILCCLLDQRVS